MSVTKSKSTTNSVNTDKSFWSLALLWGVGYAFLLVNLSGKYDEFAASLSSINEILSRHTEILQQEPTTITPISSDTANVCLEAQNYSSPSPVVSPLAGYVDHAVKEYKNILQERVVSQVESWNFLPEFPGANEVEMGSCPNVSPKIRSAPSTLPLEELDEFLWDDESDIPRYLDDLYWGCSRHAVDDPGFTPKCWGVLYDLVYRPRCTTRFDSRIQCQKGKQPDMVHVDSSPESILDGHFASDTLNVVIIGAGPTGLFLANALTELNKLEKTAWRPQIRVVVIENRLAASGVKQGFVRNWQTIPHLVGMAEPIDERLGRIFARITERNFFALPLNAIETLLLLSCRDMGVKFLYGNLTDYTDYLSQQPNLLVFDATGHRLDGLVRGNNCPRPLPVPGIQSGTLDMEETISPWTPLEENQDWYYLSEQQHEILSDYNYNINVARKGDILYPLTNEGLPYASWWLHVHEIPYDEEEYEIESFWYSRSAYSEFCQACRDEDAELLEREEHTGTCEKFCSPNNFFDSVQWFREDIRESLVQDPFTAWFAIKGANVFLTGMEAKRLMEIVDDLGYAKHPVGMPITMLPFEDMEEEPVFRDGQLLEGLKALSYLKKEGDRPPVISVFQHRPYVYKNGEIKGDLFGSQTPILRIGDSLATGDPNRSSGFVAHVWMVRRLVCRIRGADKECWKEYDEEH